MTQDEELNSTNSYSVFGMPEEVDDIGNPYGYTGEAQDITGYNYLRARYYDSQTGTFLMQDSYEGEEDNQLSQKGGCSLDKELIKEMINRTDLIVDPGIEEDVKVFLEAILLSKNII